MGTVLVGDVLIDDIYISMLMGNYIMVMMLMKMCGVLTWI